HVQKEYFSTRTATAIVIANMIGTGVFTSLGFQLVNIQSYVGIMALWIVGGIVALCGALSYAELASRLPRSGGEYNFLTQIYHPCAGFISGWVSATVGFAAPTALAAVTFGTYLQALLPQAPPLISATLLVCASVFVHATSHRNSGALQTIFTWLKLLLIVGFSVLVLANLPAWQPLRAQPNVQDLHTLISSDFAVSLIYVSFAYSGWNVATYLAGEVRSPQHQVPRVLIIGTLVVTVCYLLLNSVFMLSAPVENLVGKLDVGYVAAVAAFGELGGKILGGMLALLLISTVSAMIIAAPRVLQMVGQDYPFFAKLARCNKHQIPATAVYTQGAIALIFMWSASFETILVFSGATMALNTLFSVLGLFILRRRNDVAPVFKQPWYPLPALIFTAITSATLI
ncbi:MAG TPA: amino acid permease, partial [Pseudomonadales bacterium]|nr:amino acid permease [Pseudomonadales bacterium]